MCPPSQGPGPNWQVHHISSASHLQLHCDCDPVQSNHSDSYMKESLLFVVLLIDPQMSSTSPWWAYIPPWETGSFLHVPAEGHTQGMVALKQSSYSEATEQTSMMMMMKFYQYEEEVFCYPLSLLYWGQKKRDSVVTMDVNAHERTGPPRYPSRSQEN